QMQQPGAHAAARACRTFCPRQSKQSRLDVWCRIVPNRMVRGIIADADPDYPRDPDKQSAFRPKPRQSAAHRDLRGDHVARNVVALFTYRSVAGVCSPANPVLAPAIRDTPALCRTHAGVESLAAA